MKRNHTKFRTALALLLAVLMSVFALPVALAEDAAPDLTGLTAFVFNGASVTVTEGADANYDVVVVTSDGTESSPASLTNADGSVTYSVPDETTGGELQVGIKKKGGSYVFSGEGTGSIVVKKQATGDAILYLNGLTLTSAFTALITVNKDSTAACTVHAVAGTVNNLTDAVQNNDEVYTANAMAENAVIKGKAGSTLVITGGGTLNLTANGKNGIKANNLLTIEGDVTLNVTAPDNGISGENQITINSGAVTVTTREGDGIKAAADDQPVGALVINGGTVTVDSYGDCLQATASVTITGGTLDLTAYGGHAVTYNGDSDAYPSAKGIKVSGDYTVTDETTGAQTEVAATDCQLVISGGVFTINTPDDAIHSDQDVTITGGRFTIQTADDAIHAEYVTTLGAQNGADTDLVITVQTCYEGIEGAAVTVYSGTYKIYSTDDAINAANSDLRGESNTSLDADGALTIQNATVLAIGSSDMASAPAAGSQPYVVWTASGAATASNASSGGSGGFGPGGGFNPGRPGQGGFGPGGGFGGQGGSGFIANNTAVTVTDANGNELFSTTAYWNAQNTGTVNYVLFSSPDLTAGSRYTLTLGEGAGDPDMGTDPDPDEQPAMGDVNADGTVDARDALLTLQHAVQKTTLTAAQQARADVNGDKTIDAKDALKILQFAVGKITSF